MQLSKAALFVSALALVASTGFASRSLHQLTPGPAPAGCQTVAQTATASGLTTLLAAVDAAGLTSTLSSPDLAYTVFAPTDAAFTDAFAALNVTAEQVLGNTEVLTAILSNHLLAYPLTAANLLSAGTVNTEYQFRPINVTQVGSSVEVSTPVNTATVVTADVQACKSIVHVIDAVLIPEL